MSFSMTRIEEKARIGRKNGGEWLGCPLARLFREKKTARLGKKASFGRKTGENSLGVAPRPPYSRENYGQNE